MNNNHFIIGVPTYNRSHLIERVYRSVLEQEYTRWTLLFVDDCSSDDSAQVLQQFSAEDERVRFLRMPQNSGVNKVRNKIIDTALEIDPDALLLFIDDDDFLSESCLKTADQAINENPFFGWYTLDCCFENGELISKLKRYGELSYLDDYMFGKDMRGDMTHILRVRDIEQTRFTEEFKNAEEWYFWCLLSSRMPLYAINSIGSIKEYLPEGLTQSGMNRDRAIEVLEFKIRVLEPIVGRKRLLHQYVTLAKTYLQGQSHEHVDRAKELLGLVFHSSPFYLRQYKHWFHCLKVQLFG